MKLFCLFITALFLGNNVSFANKEIAVAGAIQPMPVTIYKIESLRVIDEHIDSRMPLNSFLNIEVKGTYEANGESDKLYAHIQPSERINPWMPRPRASIASSEYEMKLYSVRDGQSIRLEQGGISAVSIQKKFSAVVKFRPMMWSGGSLYFDGKMVARNWNLRIAKIPQTASRLQWAGVDATLRYEDTVKKWIHHVYGVNR